MEKKTEEKGLAKIENGILAKIRRFLVSIFKRKQFEETKNIVDNNEKEDSKEEGVNQVEKESNTDDIPKLREFSVEEYFDENDKKRHDGENIDDESELNSEDNIEKNGSSAYESDRQEIQQETKNNEKEELEKKLMNYYENIKKCTYINK